jgi:hypothetical protein
MEIIQCKLKIILKKWRTACIKYRWKRSNIAKFDMQYVHVIINLANLRFLKTISDLLLQCDCNALGGGGGICQQD